MFGKWLKLTSWRHGPEYIWRAEPEPNSLQGRFDVPTEDEVYDTPANSAGQLLELRTRVALAERLRAAADELYPPDAHPGVGGRKRCACGKPLRTTADVVQHFDAELMAMRAGKLGVASAATRLLIVRMLLVACPGCVQTDIGQALGVKLT